MLRRRLLGWATMSWTGLVLVGCGGSDLVEPEGDLTSDAVALADLTSFDQFRESIRTLAEFGDREQGSESNRLAGEWIEQQLESWGYDVVRHPFQFRGEPRENLYATKVGDTRPDQMYIISAHFDGRGGGGGADDDASGTALVLEAARAFADVGVSTDISVRFVLWDAEEVGLVGSSAYVEERVGLQGIEAPEGSGLYPEPTWLGVVQHDMILFDHGLPPGPDQIPGADLDVEYQASSDRAGASFLLARDLREWSGVASLRYPAEIGDNMRSTDSWPFRNHTASVSVRENRRDEIGQGTNPHWHQPTDVFEAYSDDDFRLGFDAVRMTVATVGYLAGVRVR